MSRGTTRVVITVAKSAEVRAKEFKRACEWARVKTLEMYHDKFMPHHFTSGGFSKYKYDLRVLGYDTGTGDEMDALTGTEIRYKYHRGVVLEEEPMGTTFREAAEAMPDKEARSKRFAFLNKRGILDRQKYRLLGVPNQPLVRTSKTKELVMGSPSFRQVNGWTTDMVMGVPAYIYMHYRTDARNPGARSSANFHRKDPDKAAELSRVAPNERVAMRQTFEKELFGCLKMLGY